MKKSVCLRIVSVCLFLCVFSVTSNAQTINTFDNFPDPQFRATVEKFMGVVPGGAFTANDAVAKTGTMIGNDVGISNIAGLEFFPNITGLNLARNSIIDSSTISLLTSLQSLNLSGNLLTTIDLSSNAAIRDLKLGTNQLSAIGGLTTTLLNLRALNIENNQFSGIDLSNQFLLEDLNIKDNQFSEISLTNNINLISLNASGNTLSALDLSTNLDLRELIIADNQFTSFAPTSNLQLPNDPLNFQLEVFNVSGNNITTVQASDFGRMSFLLSLDVSNNNISTINISPLTNLEHLNASNNNKNLNSGFHSLNTNSNINLTSLNLSDNAISRVDLSSISGVTFTNNTNLVSLNLSGNFIGDSTITSVTLVHNMLAGIDPGAPSANDTLQILNLSRNRIDGITFANRAMRNLDLSYNTLQILSVTGYTALERLNIASNTILFTSKSLPALGVQNNAIALNPAATVNTVTTPLDLTANAGSTGTLTYVDLTNTGALAFKVDGINPSSNFHNDNLIYLASHQLVILPQDTSITTLIAASNEIYSVSGRIDPTFITQTSSNIPTSGTHALSLLNHTDVINGNMTLDLRRNRLQVADETNELATVTAFLGPPRFQVTGELVDGFAYTPRAQPSDQTGLLFTNEQDALNTQGITVLQPNGGEQYESPHTDVPLFYAVEAVAGAANNNVLIEVSYDGGATFSTIQAVESPASTGVGLEMTTGQWNIPANQDSSQALIRVSRVDDPTVVDVSDQFFTVGRGSSLTQVFSGVTMSFGGVLFVDPVSSDPSVNIAIELSDPAGLTGYQLRIAYDPNRFFFEDGSVDKSVGVTEPFTDPFVNNDNQAGLLRIASTSITSVGTGLGQSEIVRFTLNAFSFAEVGSAPIEIVNSGTFLNDGQIEYIASQGTISLINIFIWGDLTGDDIAGVLDAASILRWSVGIINEFPAYPGIINPAFPPAADVSGDNFIGTLDASAILSFVADPIANPFPADLNLDGRGPDPLVAKIGTKQLEELSVVQSSPGVLKFSADNEDGLFGYIIKVHYDPKSVEMDRKDVVSLIPNATVIVNDTKPGEMIVAGAVFPAVTPGETGLFAIEYDAKTEDAAVMIDLQRSTINDRNISLPDGVSLPIQLNSSTTVPGWMLY